MAPAQVREEAAGAVPLMRGGHATVETRLDGRRRGHVPDALHGPENGGTQRLRHREPQGPVDGCELVPEELVKLRLVVGLVLRAVPPEPVAALGHLQRLEGEGARGVVHGTGMLVVRLAGLAQALPGFVVLLVADPDVVIRTDPRARMDAAERGRLDLRQSLRHGQG
jgi:hypothetical protein